MTDKPRTRKQRQSPPQADNMDDPEDATPAAPTRSQPSLAARSTVGFPSPADSHTERQLDLNQYLVRHEAATFFIRVKGDSMMDAGILNNDVLVVDRSLTPRQGSIVVAVVDGEFTVRILESDKAGQPCLKSANKQHPLVPIQKDADVEIWGVVTGSVRKYR